MAYYNLQVHSAYDLLNSTIKYKELFEKLKSDNQDSVVIVDPNMYGAIKAYKEAKKTGTNLISGLEVKLGYGISFLTFNILCKNERMFHKLFELSTRFLNEEELSLEAFLADMKDFKDDFVLIVTSELRDSIEFSYLQEQLIGYNFYFGFNEKFNYSIYTYYDNIVYTKPSYYLNKEHYQQVVVARAIRDNAKLNIRELTTTIGDHFVRSSEDFSVLLQSDNEEYTFILQKSLDNQQKIIDKCHYELEFSGYHLPKYIYGEHEDVFAKMSAKDYLRYLVQKGAKEKLVGKDYYAYKKRYEYELKIIDDMLTDKAIKESGVKVNQAEVNRIVEDIAAKNGLTYGQFLDALDYQGISLNAFKQQISRQMLMAGGRD